jgi:hypothetical protein
MRKVMQNIPFILMITITPPPVPMYGPPNMVSVTPMPTPGIVSILPTPTPNGHPFEAIIALIIVIILAGIGLVYLLSHMRKK